MKSQYTGIKRIFMACKYSLDGLKTCFLSEAAFRQDLLICIVGWCVLPLLNLGFYSKMAMGLSLVFIILAELVNTAIERVVDRIGPEYNKLSKQAKDIGSAIVCITLVSVGVFWGLMVLHSF